MVECKRVQGFRGTSWCWDIFWYIDVLMMCPCLQKLQGFREATWRPDKSRRRTRLRAPACRLRLTSVVPLLLTCKHCQKAFSSNKPLRNHTVTKVRLDEKHWLKQFHLWFKHLPLCVERNYKSLLPALRVSFRGNQFLLNLVKRHYFVLIALLNDEHRSRSLSGLEIRVNRTAVFINALPAQYNLTFNIKPSTSNQSSVQNYQPQNQILE